MIYIADAHGVVDSVYHTLINHINCKIPILIVSYHDNFVFNEKLLSLKKGEFILIDFIEMGWDYDWSKHSLDNYCKRFQGKAGDEWAKFHEWVSEKPLLIFKRELDIPTSKAGGYYPIEYPNLTNKYPVQTKEEFNARPIDLFSYWGRSNEIRVQTHGDIWKGASTYGYSVCDNLYYFNEFMKEEKGKKIVSLWIPHYGRTDISNLLAINGMSKLSLSLPGAGIKCFRSTGEAPVNSVMVCKNDNLAWSYPFIDGVNCIKWDNYLSLNQTIEIALKNENLYEIYLEGMETADKYRRDNYINNYILPLINSI